MSDLEDIEDIALPRVAKRGPYKVEVEAGKEYWWCSCGLSKNQPFCDGSHNMHPDSGLKPVKYVAEEDGTVWMCGCKQTKSAPMCDGTHNSLPEESQESSSNPIGTDKGKESAHNDAPPAASASGSSVHTTFCAAAKMTGGLAIAGGLTCLLAGPRVGEWYQTTPVSVTHGTLYRLLGASCGMAGVAIFASAQSPSAETRRNVALGTAVGLGAIASVLGSAVVSHSSLWTVYTTMEAAGSAALASFWLYEAFRQHNSLLAEL